MFSKIMSAKDNITRGMWTLKNRAEFEANVRAAKRAIKKQEREAERARAACDVSGLDEIDVDKLIDDICTANVTGVELLGLQLEEEKLHKLYKKFHKLAGEKGLDLAEDDFVKLYIMKQKELDDPVEKETAADVADDEPVIKPKVTPNVDESKKDDGEAEELKPRKSFKGFVDLKKILKDDGKKNDDSAAEEEEKKVDDAPKTEEKSEKQPRSKKAAKNKDKVDSKSEPTPVEAQDEPKKDEEKTTKRNTRPNGKKARKAAQAAAKAAAEEAKQKEGEV